MCDYKIGALSDLISGTETESLNPFSNLFTQDKKQKPSLKEEVPQPPASDEEENDDISPSTSPKKNVKAEKGFRPDETKDRIVDKESDERTIFLGNLPLSMAGNKKALKKLCSSLGDVENVRFRGAAKPDLKTSKKAAVITKNFHPNRHNILGYVKFKEIRSVEKAVAELNGKQVEGNVIRVDFCGDKSTKSSQDQKKAVFIGNLDFNTEENAIREHFKDCGGEILDIRIVRDKMTGMGKGFGYVNFDSEDSVEQALRLHLSDFNGRQIRVMRSHNKPKKLVPMKDKSHQLKNKNHGAPRYAPKRVFKKEAKNTFMGLKTEDKKMKRKKSKGDLKKKTMAKKLLRK